ncbi:two-component regulator propeller domain-containing protein [Aequorivita marina]|uniref:type IX secretion system anionic LPS delivery protein PorZ n=1 Tax=Aequorivita marina TaxID=3073654 RepID=UPI002875BCC2|nr:two-component regulator propeller domain-containing protein [Aequorivita sp. S2608]MDS1298868.1 two-component regulator propeller domain-containing protein [Aequorivita sp. S2608]
MKWLANAFLFLIPLLVTSQNFEDRWTGHFSYVSVKDISHGNNKVYVGAENAVFSYDISTLEITTLSTINGLSGEFISSIHYSQEYKLLIIGYENGLMDVVRENEEDILKVVDIFEKQTIPPNKKRINNFDEHNGKLYIATQYGISVYDLERLEFGDTYFIGDGGGQINILQTIVQEPYIFAASKGNGMRRAMVDDDDLIDYRNWTTIINGGFRAVGQVGSELYASNRSNTVLRFTPEGNTTAVESYSSNIQKFRAADNLLTITTTNAVYSYSEGFIEEASATSIQEFDLNLEAGYGFGNNLYLGTKEDGLLIVPFGSTLPTQVLPNGPIMNSPFAIDASPGQLWVSFGEVDVDYNPYPLSPNGISHLKDTIWTNTSYEDLSLAVGGEPTDLVKVSINPENFDEVYMSSYEKGLLKIVEGTPTVLYNETNSALEKAFLGSNDAGIRLYGSQFDKQNNLWFAQSRINEGIIKLTPNGQFQKFDVSSIINAENEIALTDLVVTRGNNIFVGTYKNGLIGYNTNTNTFNKMGKGQGAGNLPSTKVKTIAVDAQNRLWIGTLKGLRVLYSPGSFFEQGVVPESQAIIILENGVAQELLYEQSVTDIEVDGSNNKWIATATSGVFYLSPNGQETLMRFTKDNSPLPTNNVQDIAIDPFTGVVYFATTHGLVAYKGTATAPGDNLDNLHAFPNPVRPEFNGNVTIDGLTAKANVKITDITGNLVFEETSQGGSVLWDTTAFGKYKVQSGVYLVLVTTDDSMETKVSKIMIIR